MLLRRYPGSVPDVDFMWDCGDDPKAFKSSNPDDPIPFLFNFCKLAHSIDVPFPDWSFWGWPELQILPWANQSAKIVQGGLDAGEWRRRKKTVSPGRGLQSDFFGMSGRSTLSFLKEQNVGSRISCEIIGVL
jgi:hypothetical protein